MNFKRGKPKSTRAGCLLCKSHKAAGNSKKFSNRVRPVGVYTEPGTNITYPVFAPSQRTISVYKQALKDLKAGKFIKVDDVDRFFEEL